MNCFYVYEHWRPDTGQPFYVGKGKGNRAYRFERRSKYHQNIVAKLAKDGLVPEVRIVASGLLEQRAFDLEINRIAELKYEGVNLANLTYGGDGSTGYRHTSVTKERMKKSPAQIEEIKLRQTGRSLSPEAREKIRTIRRGSRQTAATKAKLSKIFKNRIFTSEWRAKISESLKGRIISDETKSLWSAQRRGRKRKPLSEETRQKISASLKGHAVSDITRAKIAVLWRKRHKRFERPRPILAE